MIVIIIIIKFTTRESIHKRQSLYKVSATKRNTYKNNVTPHTGFHHTFDRQTKLQNLNTTSYLISINTHKVVQ